MDAGDGVCFGECREVCQPDDSPTCTPGTNNTLYVNNKRKTTKKPAGPFYNLLGGLNQEPPARTEKAEAALTGLKAVLGRAPALGLPDIEPPPICVHMITPRVATRPDCGAPTPANHRL